MTIADQWRESFADIADTIQDRLITEFLDEYAVGFNPDPGEITASFLEYVEYIEDNFGDDDPVCEHFASWMESCYQDMVEGNL
jgi:hypothetical protein